MHVPKRFELKHLLVLIPLAGIAVSLWAAATGAAVMSQAGKIACDVSDVVSCSKVIGSKYGLLLGVPLGYWGLAFWLGVLALYAAPLFHDAGEKTIALARLAFGATGLAFSLCLGFISIFIIRSFCMICEAMQLLVIAFFVIALLDFLKLRNAPLDAQVRPIVIGAAGLALLVAAPLVAGGIIASRTRVAGPSFASAEEAFKKLERDVFYAKKGIHSLGPSYARVTLTIYTDFECSWCRKLHAMLFDEINRSGVKDLLVVFRNYPLDMHAHSKDLALAARCAGRQGKFWEFANWAFETGEAKQSDPALEALFSPRGLAGRAGELGLDTDLFIRCFDAKEEMPAIDADRKEAEKLGLKGTPFILLNDRPYRAVWSEPGRLAKDIRVAAGLEKGGDQSLFGYRKEPRPLWSYLVPFYGRLAPMVTSFKYDMDKDGKTDYIALTLRDYGLMAMVLTDANHDGEIDDFSWVMGSYSDPHKSQVLYNEIMLPELRTRVWYGPGNIKLIAMEDMDKNGTYETAVYYNERARPQTMGGTVARFETDASGDGRPDVWGYPGSRMEIDRNLDGVPDAVTLDKKEMNQNTAMIEKGVKLEKLLGRPMAPGESWALNPALITSKLNRALIPYPHPGVWENK